MKREVTRLQRKLSQLESPAQVVGSLRQLCGRGGILQHQPQEGDAPMDAEDDERPHVKFRHEDTDGHYAAPQETGTAHCADDALMAALERVRIGALVA